MVEGCSNGCSLNGSLRPQPFKSPHIDGMTWKPENLTKGSQWYINVNQSQKLISILTVQFGPNLEILTLIGGELLRVQAQNGLNFDF